MNAAIEELEQLLYNYLSEIFEFESAITVAYKLDDLPFNMLSRFPQKESIFYKNKKTDYRFHGNGCTLIINGVEIQYSIYTDRVNYIAISPWDFLRFIQTTDYKGLTKSLTQVQTLEYLEKLEKHKVVNKIFQNYHVYEINLKWYKNFVPR